MTRYPRCLAALIPLVACAAPARPQPQSWSERFAARVPGSVGLLAIGEFEPGAVPRAMLDSLDANVLTMVDDQFARAPVFASCAELVQRLGAATGGRFAFVLRPGGEQTFLMHPRRPADMAFPEWALVLWRRDGDAAALAELVAQFERGMSDYHAHFRFLRTYFRQQRPGARVYSLETAPGIGGGMLSVCHSDDMLAFGNSNQLLTQLMRPEPSVDGSFAAELNADAIDFDAPPPGVGRAWYRPEVLRRVPSLVFGEALAPLTAADRPLAGRFDFTPADLRAELTAWWRE